MPYYGYYLDPTYLLVILGYILCALASSNVKHTFKKYGQVMNRSGLTGADVAQRILQSQGIYDVRVEHVTGELTDHYDPASKVVRLSDTVYGQTTISAVSVAAHECGHAVQHAKGYVPLTLRSAIYPVVNISSMAAVPLLIIGFILGLTGLAQIGLILFAFVLAFQVITLPVEFNASSRALRILEGSGYLMEEEMGGAKKVLFAAALTYVASVASTALQLLRFAMMLNRRR